MKTEEGRQSSEKITFIQFQYRVQNRLKHQYCLHELSLKSPHAPTFCLLHVLAYHRVSMISIQQNGAAHMHRILVASFFGKCSTSHFCLWMPLSGRLPNDWHWCIYTVYIYIHIPCTCVQRARSSYIMYINVGSMCHFTIHGWLSWRCGTWKYEFQIL